jgi:hypothetical protein
MSLDELIDALRQATEGSSKLDDQIFATMSGYKHVSGSLVSGGMLSEDYWLTRAPDNVLGGQILVGRSPMCSFDISAARKLIESGMLFSVEGNAGDHQQGRYGKARIWCAPEYAKIESMARIDVEAKAATPALAICLAAALVRRARRG